MIAGDELISLFGFLSTLETCPKGERDNIESNERVKGPHRVRRIVQYQHVYSTLSSNFLDNPLKRKDYR